MTCGVNSRLKQGEKVGDLKSKKAAFYAKINHNIDSRKNRQFTLQKMGTNRRGVIRTLTPATTSMVQIITKKLLK
jgi:hypothetical protein